MKALRPLRSGSFLVALGLAACGGTAAPASAPGGGTPSAAELEALFRARTESARARFVEADAEFMSGMIAHHAQALVMAGLAPSHAASPAVRTLAARIINAQADEIDLMQRWLRDRGRPAPEVHIEGATLMLHGAGHDHHDHHDHGSMPGMLTPEQLRELDAARGAEFDRLFLVYMIRHHRGAVVMVDRLLATDGAGQDPTVFKFASDVQADQTTEIRRMERMLAALVTGIDAP
jgi:uncharacterized protein (DUF305 family)